MTQPVAVTGASGFIGRVLVRRLRGRGGLRGLFRTRSPEAEAWRERGHEPVFGDLSDEDALASLVEDVSVVYHLAARTAKDAPEASRRVNVEGTERLARAAGAAGVQRLVYVSSISVYAATEPTDPGATAAERKGSDGVHTLTEEVEPRKTELLNPYSLTKYEGELVVRALAGSGEGPDFTVVRPTNVYGPGGRAWFLDWVERLQRLPVVIGGDVPVDMVHVDDVAAALVQAGESPSASGEILHIGHETVTLADYVRRLGEAVGRDVRRLPPVLDRLARVVIEKGHRMLKGNRMSTPLRRAVRYPHAKARRLIGYDPEIPLEEGIEQLGRWYRSEHGSSA